MNRKFTVLVLIMIAAFIGLSTACAENQTANNTTYFLEAQYPISIDEMTHDIGIQPFFKNFNSTTLTWLKGFNSDYVIYENDDYYFLMNSTDSGKLLQNDTQGISYHNKITANILENRTMGKGLHNILLVDNVEVISQELNSAL